MAGVTPPSGAYRVGTTWRDVIDAATTVGRDPIPWLATVAPLARLEIIARSSPLFAYLGRALHSSHTGGTGFLVEPNVVYTDGTENTARAAFGYRIGMTMAEWACRGLLGVGATVHAEAHTPTGAGPAWLSTSGLPDLVGYHLGTGLPWLVEAKGALRLEKGRLRKGVEQLCRPDLMHGPHVKVLCGTSLADRLFMTLDVEEQNGPPTSYDGSADDERMYNLAHSRMPHYLALTAMPRSAWRVLPVGAGVSERENRRGGVGTVTLLEEDPSTTAERATVRVRPRLGNARFDMLTGQVPGTDLVIGMSRPLYAACAALAPIAGAVASEVDDELPRLSSYAESDDIESNRYERWLVQRQVERRRRREAVERIRDGYEEGVGRSWEGLTNGPVVFTPDARQGFLEAATADTYLAVDAAAVPGFQRPS